MRICNVSIIGLDKIGVKLIKNVKSGTALKWELIRK